MGQQEMNDQKKATVTRKDITGAADGEGLPNVEARRAKGEFVRGVSTAREWIGSPQYPVEAGRYHLYGAYNCPWCHRVMLARSLLGLEDAITMDVLMPTRTEEGHPQGEGKWQFKPEGLTARNGAFVRFPQCTADSVNGKDTVVEIYALCGLEQKSVPILFDKKTGTVVNNESSEILRMMETVLLPLSTHEAPLQLYPEAHSEAIDDMNSFVYADINNGAYKAGFSSSQDAYEEAFKKYFDAFDRLEGILEKSTFLCGDQPTEADIRLFPTVYRHDPVYHNRMKLNKRFVSDFPNLWRWMCDLYALPGVAQQSPLEHMKQGYFGRTGNSTVPVGPEGYPGLLQDRTYAARRQALLRAL